MYWCDVWMRKKGNDDCDYSNTPSTPPTPTTYYPYYPYYLYYLYYPFHQVERNVCTSNIALNIWA